MFVLTLIFFFFKFNIVQFSCSVVSDSATPWTAAHQASLSITNSLRLLKLMCIESVMPSSHFILWRPLLLLPSVLLPSIRVFSSESVLCIRWLKYWSFSSNCLLIMITMLASRQPHKTVAQNNKHSFCLKVSRPAGVPVWSWLNLLMGLWSAVNWLGGQVR